MQELTQILEDLQKLKSTLNDGPATKGLLPINLGELLIINFEAAHKILNTEIN